MIADSVKVSVFGKISDKLYSAQITSVSGRCKSAYVISHKPVTEYFEGVVVAVAEFDGLDGERPIISQYGEVFYEPELRQVLSKLKNIKLKSIVCLYEKSCGAVIFYKSRQNTKILLVKNSNGRYWSFPKGHIEDGETAVQTARREIGEEAGLHDVDMLGWLGKIHFRYRRIDRLVLMTTQIYLVRVRTDGNEIQKEEWMNGIRWFPFNEALDLIEYEDIAKLMLKAKTRIREEKL